jgi:hypothetical protein
MLSPAALSTLTSTFRSIRDRNTALGVWAAVSGIGGAAGVLFGGLHRVPVGGYCHRTSLARTIGAPYRTRPELRKPGRTTHV